MAPGSIEKERSISGDGKEESKPYVAAYTFDTAAIFVSVEDITLIP